MATMSSQSFPAPAFDLGAVLRSVVRLCARGFRAVQVSVAERTRADEARAVRDLAERYAKTDPGFAADLYAAAARHEGMTMR
jgi:hypothetical protein